MLRPVGEGRWEALVQPGRRCRVGARVELAGGVARGRIVGEGESGTRVVEIEAPWPVRELLERHGLPPLPPYIARHDAPKPEDRERYQTVYARDDGSVAAPTAGLHFTPELLARLAARGIAAHYLTLHVGPGTFRPLRATRLDEHHLEAEAIEIPAETAARGGRGDARRAAGSSRWGRPRRGRSSGRREGDGRIRAGAGAADLFIRPGHRFRVVDALVTNFHLPRSTLLVLVAALAGREPDPGRLSPRGRRALPLLLVRRRDADRSERMQRLRLRAHPAPTAPLAAAGCAPRTARSRRRPSCRWRRRARSRA